MRRRWYYFKRMLQADRLFVVQMIGNIIRMIQYAGRWIVLAVVCVAALYLGRGLCAGAWKDFYENYAVRIADDVVRGFLPAWKEDEGTAFYLESRKNGSRRTKEYEEIFGIENENGVLRAEWIADREQNQGVYGDDRGKNAWGSGNADENAQDRTKTESSEEWGNSGKSGTGENGSSQNEKTTLAGLLAAGTFNTGNSGIILEKLNDYDYLMKKFYNVHPTTTAGRDLMRAENFLAADLSIEKNANVPQILIYHTHSQETFADSREGQVEDTIVGVGDHLAELLEKTYGYRVLHVTDAFDMMGGQLDRSKAYDYARASIEKVLEENPSVEVVIDLHRDGVPDDRHLVTEIDGKPTAQLLFYNGLSYTVNQGAVSYLPNPYIEENLAFSFQLEYQAAQYYPKLYRGIYLAGLRYNLHLKPRALLLEAGAQTNTVEEVRNAMEPFADILNRVLKGSDKNG